MSMYLGVNSITSEYFLKAPYPHSYHNLYERTIIREGILEWTQKPYQPIKVEMSHIRYLVKHTNMETH